MKRMFTVAKRHSWSSGIKQFCTNLGCGWVRKPKGNGRGEATTISVYAHGGSGDFKAYKPVPPCGSKP